MCPPTGAGPSATSPYYNRVSGDRFKGGDTGVSRGGDARDARVSADARYICRRAQRGEEDIGRSVGRYHRTSTSPTAYITAHTTVLSSCAGAGITEPFHEVDLVVVPASQLAARRRERQSSKRIRYRGHSSRRRNAPRPYKVVRDIGIGTGAGGGVRNLVGATPTRSIAARGPISGKLVPSRRV